MKFSALVLATLLLSPVMEVNAAGGGGSGGGVGATARVDPVLQAANAAIARKDWSAAQTSLKQALASNPQNADYHNLYAFSLRKAPNPDMDAVFSHYEEALRIDPRHLGAHEYIGEAYLMVGNLAKAKEHLATLDKLCFLPCEQYSDLKEAISKYQRGHPG